MGNDGLLDLGVELVYDIMRSNVVLNYRKYKTSYPDTSSNKCFSLITLAGSIQPCILIGPKNPSPNSKHLIPSIRRLSSFFPDMPKHRALITLPPIHPGQIHQNKWANRK